MRTLVLGGARSGKSEHAEALLPPDGDAVYLATAVRDASDPEWEQRIRAHAARRPACWRTVELGAAGGLAAALAEPRETPVLVDDLGAWLARLLDEEGAWDGDEAALRVARGELDSLVTAVASYPGELVLVSAEVGLGVIPASRSGRLFSDELGALNARLARECHRASLLVAGVEVRLKEGAWAAGE
jgi:adenosylcobinamide kinase/adenosylcobinamide-phosphate guanylyltransferase